MKTMIGIHGSAKPADHINGPTGCWVHYNIVQSMDEDEHDVWTYDGLWFEVGEHENVERGILPAGEVWNDELHRIFRNAVHRRSDDLYNMAYRHKRTASDPTVWDSYINALDEWNADVSAMAPDYSVIVPDLPTMP